MSYVSDDSSLWFNLAGVVAAYQPVRAPGPMAARYNQAHGGDNRYKLIIGGTVPTFSPFTGWTHDVTHYWDTGIYSFYDWTGVVRYTDVLVNQCEYSLNGDVSAPRLSCGGMWTGSTQFITRWGDGYRISEIADSTRGVGCQAWKNQYKDGVYLGQSSGSWSAGTPSGTTMKIGAPRSPAQLKVLCVAIYARTLSPAEVWSVSRQMAYCEINPDWSAWGRRRQWFYLAPSFLAAWAARNNQTIGPGQGTSL